MDELERWLTSMGLERHASVLRANDIDAALNARPSAGLANKQPANAAPPEFVAVQLKYPSQR